MLSVLVTLHVKTLEIARAWLQAEEEAALVLKKNLYEFGCATGTEFEKTYAGDCCGGEGERGRAA